MPTGNAAKLENQGRKYPDQQQLNLHAEETMSG